jgi:hypothetical protein
MDTVESSRILRLFNEKAAKLEKLRFTQGILNANSGVTITANQQATEIKRYGPDEESIDAFVLTIRFFVQDNEKISLRNLEQLYHGLAINSTLQEQIVAARTQLNQFLNSQTIVTMNGETLTFRGVFEVFMWGGLAHANPEKKVAYDSWSKLPLYPILEGSPHETEKIVR